MTRNLPFIGAVLVAILSSTGCVERITVSRGTRISPDYRGVTSAEVTEAFTRHVRGEQLSMAATLIDFAYVRAVTRERGRTEDAEREAYRRYVSKQTTFYVHLVLHGRESCRPGSAPREEDDEERREGDEDEGEALDLRSWTFTLNSSTGRQRTPEDVEPGPTQLAPSGGCLVQGYLHFRGNVGSRDQWLQLEASLREERRLRADLRWDVTLFSSSRGGERPSRPAGTTRPPPRSRPPADVPIPVDERPQEESVGAGVSAGDESSSDEVEESDEGSEVTPAPIVPRQENSW